MCRGLISIGNDFPFFEKKACVSTVKGKEFDIIKSDMLRDNNHWTVMFWWPKDFTFVCPTEISSFNDSFDDFEDRDTKIIGASTDSEFSHLAWRQNNQNLKNIKFPMLADTSKSLSEELGILDNTEKVANRATFIIDPLGIIRWISVYDMKIGRSVKEILRVLDALQSDELCPCNWELGDDNIKI
ncbi:MAG: peroxiredoxin [Bacteroides sp.]|nr:MAG: peroxiredoxin [Bacteroides sp.]